MLKICDIEGLLGGGKTVVGCLLSVIGYLLELCSCCRLRVEEFAMLMLRVAGCCLCLGYCFDDLAVLVAGCGFGTDGALLLLRVTGCEFEE